jgi:hypothetical protein
MWGGLETKQLHRSGGISYLDELTGDSAPFYLFFGIILSFSFVVTLSALREQLLLQRGKKSP